MSEGVPAEASPEASPAVAGTSKATTTTAAIGLSSFIVFLANRVHHPVTREILTVLAPSLGTGLTFLATVGAKQVYHWRGNRQLQRWIKELELERPKALPTRRREIDADITEYRAKLKQRRLDNLP
jgi:hypothetical protein